MLRSSVAIDEPCPAGTPLPTRYAGHLPLQGEGCWTPHLFDKSVFVSVCIPQQATHSAPQIAGRCAALMRFQVVRDYAFGVGVSTMSLSIVR